MNWTLIGRGTWTVVIIGVLGGLVYAAYRVQHLSCSRLDIYGAIQADSVSIHALALPVDSTTSAALVADRVRRHPWIRHSSATCYPSGSFFVRVQERVPVLLVTDRSGRGTHYLDPGGFMMPVTARSVFDVPLLRDLAEPYHPIKQVEHPAARELAQAMALLDADTRGLISEFVIGDRGVTAYAAPANGAAATEVLLGHSDLTLRLQRLRAFWDQRVMLRPEYRFHKIDLRFQGQVVTVEESASG